MTETKLTQAHAARAAGVSRTSIWRAVRDGRLSAERLADGSVRVDASELLRVYPRADLERLRNRSDRGTRTGTRDNRTPRSDGTASGEVGALREYLEELKRDKERLERELAAAAEERGRLLSMLEAKDRLLTDARPRRRWWAWWRRSHPDAAGSS